MPEVHSTAAVLSIGDELSLGQKTDTNSQWIADRLVAIGIIPVEHVTVPDDLDRHVATLVRLASEVDVIISTGGLGPTADDLSRAALAAAMGDTLVEDPIALAQVESWFASRGRPMPEINRGQALRPSRGASLHNLNGTAPGLYGQIRSGGRVCEVVCLPGPPKEMVPMFELQALPRLRPPQGRTVRTRVLHCVGIGESDLATLLGPLMDRGVNPLVGTTASGGIISIRIRYEGALSPDDADAEIRLTERKVRAVAGAYIFGAEQQTLPGVLIDLLRSRNQTLATVESCTGGMLAAAFTETGGSSTAFRQGWVTYTNFSKHREVGVPAELLNLTPEGADAAVRTGPGAVSREVAAAMCRGGVERSGADLAISVTGIAGPSGGTADKPVGTVFIGLAERGADGVIRTDVRRFKMSGDRETIRSWSVRSAMAMLWLRLAGSASTTLLREVERWDE